MITAIDTNTALILIDLQKGTTSAQTAHPVKDVLNKAAYLADEFRKAGLPVVVVHVDPRDAAWMKTRKESSQPTMPPPGPDFTEIVPEIGQHERDISIVKKTWNAFFNTPLHEELQKRKVTSIVLAGVSTSIGVEGTARAASELGYNLSFATDAMTDRIALAHEHSIKIIFPRIGEQGTSDEIVGFLKDR